jgi:hypothetical protein
LHPLRADKYIATPLPTTQPTPKYVIHISSVTPAGRNQGEYEFRLSDQAEKPLIGEYNGLAFELPHTFLESISGDFANKPKPRRHRCPAEDCRLTPGNKSRRFTQIMSENFKQLGASRFLTISNSPIPARFLDTFPIRAKIAITPSNLSSPSSPASAPSPPADFATITALLPDRLVWR